MACPACLADLTVQVFPALFRTTAKVEPETLAEDQASCYEHPQKQAVGICTHCGRFVCRLCEVEIEGNVWCPECLGPSPSRPKLAALETSRTLYDSIALALATWPLIIFLYVSVFSAPAALYVALRYWKAPGSLIPRSKWRFIAAIFIALAQLVLIVAGIIALVVAVKTASKGMVSR